MGWTIEWDKRVERQLARLGRDNARRIRDYMMQRVARVEDPRSLGKALHGRLSTYWRYRVGDYRVICSLEDAVCKVLVVRIGHRREVYR